MSSVGRRVRHFPATTRIVAGVIVNESRSWTECGCALAPVPVGSPMCGQCVRIRTQRAGWVAQMVGARV